MSATRTCPDCKGNGGVNGPRQVLGVTNPYSDECARCEGSGAVDDLGPCDRSDTEEETGKDIRCTSPADRVMGALNLCDSHAYFDALCLLKPCPNCGGSCGSGLHRGMKLGMGLVKTCSSTRAQRALQDLSEAAVKKLISDSYDEGIATGDIAISYATPLVEGEPGDDPNDEEDDDGWRYGDECLTDGERNPSMGGLQDRD